ncbi:aminotransferase class I/II-fold pyridoxal phosphate-dependent enzyme [Aureibaculum sp. 2210JD6-5]|uniref:aminotransferase class I/II-fold pyridoxal phosphate-dependent enzyme n=1 Tax=Aureibaculum sp. 2210JD6-5 TaxID=3103957 RepID=UPI002AAD05CF|nr:aminotransferase class I/II-fold pyridoxal phosphate-dependent enzyme [Aureibaculum sp. 2210JD6-5]MDY7396863.1 aminotransferase class I/II-fold pyridoxal phosphate-dependent enzyme [Aureibaculum sp. 2210JD6-5]
MAKINHNNFLDTVNEVISNAKKQNIVHLYAEDRHFEKGIITVNGNKLFHFGTTSYLGLNHDERLKQAAIEAIHKFGIQFPLSKTYISHPLYAELESKIQELYGIPAIITKNSTLGHMAVIPSAVNGKDAVILDHQVHWSVQNAAQILKLRGVPVQMIRHNNLDMLESRIKQLYNTSDRIWYMADGVYSMFGDFAPLDELKQLCIKYPKLHLYFDDVHGMSWVGKNGMGYVMSVYKDLPENCLLLATLSKSFGASGGVLICKNDKLRNKIKNFGGPLTFSAQLEPASVAAAIASANIHLSKEIYELQEDLQLRTQHFSSLLTNTNLPVIHNNTSPVFYIGTGLPVTGYNFVKRLFKEGFFVNLGLFPAVPVTNTGVRITISRNNQLKEITKLVKAMEYHFPKAILETNTTNSNIRKLFRLKSEETTTETINTGKLEIVYEKSIQQIDKSVWNRLMGQRSVFDWMGMQFLENAFSNNTAREHNWEFHYVLVKDPMNKTILATFFTRALWKEDMLAPESVSVQIEEKRKNNAYYMSNYVLSMGSLLTEGKHFYLDNKSKNTREAILIMLKKIRIIDEKKPSEMIALRDFLENDRKLTALFHDQGFIKIKMPDAAYIDNIQWKSEDDFVKGLSSRSKRHFKNDIKKFETFFDIKWQNTCKEETLEIIHQLYLNVKNNNVGLNTFAYPKNLFTKMNMDNNWEFLLLYLNNNAPSPNNSPVGMMCCYKNTDHTFVPVVVGMDYTFSRTYNIYRQLLYQTIKRAWQSNFKTIDFGLTAAFEKRKVGATIFSNHAFVQAKDNYFMEYMTTLQQG